MNPKGDGLMADRPCDECGQPVPTLELWQQVVEGGTGIARGHHSCIEAEWGPPAERGDEQVRSENDA